MTLVEILVVVGLMLLLLGMAVPSLQSSVSSRRLGAAADDLRNTWREARRAAMADGRVYRWDFCERTGKHRVLPVDDPVGDSSTPPTTEPSPEEQPPWRETRELEGAILIRSDSLDQWLEDRENAEKERESSDASVSATPSDSSDEGGPLQGAKGEPSTSESAWRPWLSFFPDGSTLDRSVLLVDESGRVLEVKAVGLTGEVIVGDPYVPRRPTDKETGQADAPSREEKSE